MAIRAYRRFVADGDHDAADALVAWLGGQPHVAAAVKRKAGIRGDLDHFLALGFLGGLLAILADAGNPGLLLVLDEVETLQRVRSDARAKALNALRQLIDEVHDGHFPGLYLLITGTPAFLDGRQGIALLPPLADRLHTEFAKDPRFDNPRAPQLRLTGFDQTRLVELGARVRDPYVSGVEESDRVRSVADDEFLGGFWRRRWPVSWADEWGSPRGCSCANWSMCSTRSSSSETSTRTPTTRSESPRRSSPTPNAPS